MAQGGKVIPFPNRQRPSEDVVSPQLSSNLEGIRQHVGVSYLSSDVIAQPAIDGYEPLVQIDGSMHLGGDGLRDFSATFGGEQFDGRIANWPGMYVVYYAFRSAIKATVKQPESPVHEGLLELAAYARDEERVLDCERDVHEIEDDITGWFSALQAKKYALGAWKSAAQKRHVAKRFHGSASRALEHVQNLSDEDAHERKRVLGDFTFRLLSADIIEPKIERILQANRQERAIL